MSREYPPNPLVGLGAIVWKDGRVLMVQRGNPPRAGIWSLPGGAQTLGETVEAGIHREIAEETGVVIELLGLVEVIDSIQRDAAGRVLYHYTIIDYVARWVAGEAVAGDDAAAVAWVDPADLHRMDLWDETVRVIEKSREWLR
ncbi:NUDIX domain-containing protein [Ferrovibrio terrae]|uniref:NUDIX domain-containing protein n=1 Tax=Ferrovibrio terrae TaxID=2594003 RepID=A0A516GX17_9PROT|nr:NUDIX hydrolase [Ferrovibrio terrae]QDO96076.1 NUDIX domain-containing protein [Ferrovibrio terrae]